MRSLLVLPTLALAAASVLAQQPAQSPVATAPNQNASQRPFPTPDTKTIHTVLGIPSGGSCPVSLQALKTPQGATLKQADRNAPHHAFALNIVLRALGNKPIRQAHVTLTGIAGGHILPAENNSASSADISEDFTITSGDAPKAQLESVVYTRRLTGIRTVSLTDITWADGTTWHAAPGYACRITPSLYLEVNAAK